MRKLLALLLCMSLAVVQLNAQSRTITGKVTDEKGAPITNASILVKGTKIGTSTATDGTFSLSVPGTAKTLVITSLNFASKDVAIGNTSSITVSLQSATQNLDEVVVVGYGTQKKKESTGSLTTVKGEAVADKPNQSFEQALAGRAAGVQITVPSGALNQPPVFRIRGTNSISLSSYPLIVVDGIPSLTGDIGSTNASANALSSINPNDIESIDIAKDAAATAIYGSRAANGVVFVTTKRGKLGVGKPRVNYDGWVGWQTPYGLPTMMNAAQYLAFKTKAVANNPSQSAVKFFQTNDAQGNPIDTKWFDYIYQTGISQSHNVNISGGNDNTNYYFSVGYLDQQGITRKTSFKRANALFNIDSKVSKSITIGGKISYSNEFNGAATSSGSLPGEAYNTGNLARSGMVLPSILAPYNNDGTYNINGATIGYANNVVGTSISYYNPVPILDLSRSNNEINHIQSSAYIQYKPLSWITLKSSYGIDYLLIDNDFFATPVTGDGYSSTGSAQANFGKYKTWLWTNTAAFDYTFAKKHNVNLLVGNEQQRRTSSGYGIAKTTLSDPAYNVIQAGWVTPNSAGSVYGENYLLSTFSRLNYNFNKKYYLSGSLRQDEASQLGVKKGVFWGASAGWEISKENFWASAKLDKIFSSFKLRGSYGKVGNIGGIGDYSPYSTFSSGLYGGAATLAFASVGNNNLQWETSKKTDFGFSFGILKERITGEFAYYKNNVDGLILNVAQSPSTGLPSNPAQNVGSMYNKGTEFSLNANIIESKNFSWTSNFNITFNTNEVTALAPGLSVLQQSTSSLETNNQTAPGYSLGYLWVVRTGGVDPSTGKRVFINSAGTPVYFQYYAPAGQYQYSTTADGLTKYVSPTGGTTITQAADAVMYQNTLPKQYGGWNNTFRFKNFEVNALFTYQFGFYLYYGTNSGLHDQRFWNNATDVLTDAWSASGDVNKKYARPVFGDNTSNGSALPLDINVFKGDFVKFKNLSLAYNLPKDILSKAKLNNAKIYLSMQNIAIFTKYPGPDPEVGSNGGTSAASNISQGVDRNTGANGRTVTIGVNIGF